MDMVRLAVPAPELELRSILGGVRVDDRVRQKLPVHVVGESFHLIAFGHSPIHINASGLFRLVDSLPGVI
ncbi:hypothetical protein [Mycobacterium sp. EPa45]|uniref:hypothetical protein n=1 Tax=Mycobacterium sp. EPa45 TaxID=1545728 RepID=UPI0011876ACA|nr:hypothetical protein [Mycobacterium sp. EPa45]